MTGGCQTHVFKAGHLLFDVGFASNHRGNFSNLDGQSLLHMNMEEPKYSKGCWLSSANRKRRKECLLNLMKHIDAHNAIERVGKLHSCLNNGEFDQQDIV